MLAFACEPRFEFVVDVLPKERIGHAPTLLAEYPQRCCAAATATTAGMQTALAELRYLLQVSAALGRVEQRMKIDLLVEKAAEAIIIPSRALVNIRAETYVWIVNAGRAKRIRVKPGSVVERGKVRILSGLTAGIQVLVAGFTGLKGGEPLSVRKVEK